MAARNVGKWLCITFMACASGIAVASCGGSGGGSVFTDGGSGDDSPGEPADATTLDDGPTLVGDDSGDSTTGCTPKTCAALGYNCGKAVSCGTIIDCGGDAANNGCPPLQYCGGGGPNVCGTGGGTDGGTTGDGGSCTPKTCASLGYDCGYAADGCGNIINCNPGDSSTGCKAPAYCGGGGYNVCGTGTKDGGTVCTPTTCAKLGYNCGAADDGCGNILMCGTCTAPQYCGGGGYDVCGPTSLAICDAGATTLTGYVYDPANNLPIYNALVYVPVGTPPTPQTGVNPATCGCTAPPAYVSAYTDVTGKFTLTNPPSGANVTVAVTLGKWQRVFTQTIQPCQANTVSNGTSGSHLTLPSTHAEGNIPLFAVDTGAVDTMECILLKMGIAQSEFVDPAIAKGVPTAAGRVHLYQATNVAGGAVIDNGTPTESALTETASVMDSYDVILFPCQGGEGPGYNAGSGFPNSLGNLLNYGTNGGRFFTTHYSYVWLYQNGAYKNTATWTVNNNSYTQEFTGFINTGFSTGATLSTWLQESPVNASTTAGQIPVNVVRNDFSAVAATSELWMSAKTTGQVAPDPKDPAAFPLHYTFDTPVGGTACGRGVFSDFHVEDASNDMSTGKAFPAECTTAADGGAPAMTPQEKLLEFMLFDLTSCVSPPVCKPLTCAQLPPGSCGPQGDGCGGVIQCPACAPPDGGSCQPETCAQQNIFCGNTGDGCGNVIQCGQCTPPQTCGGGGVQGQCGTPGGGTCTPKSCAAQGIQCGLASDGCGNVLTCPNCPTGQTCNTATGQCQQSAQ